MRTAVRYDDALLELDNTFFDDSAEGIHLDVRRCWHAGGFGYWINVSKIFKFDRAGGQ